MMEKKNSQSMLKYLSLVLIIIYSSYYYFTRSYIANIKEPLIKELALKATDFSRISAAFSIGYSLAQIGGGYLLDRFSIRWLCPGLLLLGSMASYVFIFFPNIYVAEYSRYILGMCFCLGSIGGLKYFSLVWNEKFSFFLNFIACSMSLCAALAASGSVKLLMTSLGWRVFLTFFTTFGVVLAFLLLYALKVVGNQTHTNEPHNKSNKVIVPFTESFHHIVTRPGFFWAGAYVVAIVATSYLLMDGYGNTLVCARFPCLTTAQTSLPAFFNMIGSALGSLGNILFQKLKVRTKVQMFIHGLMSISATLTLLFLDPPFYVMLICFCVAGFNSAGSALSFAWLQSNIKQKYHGLGFGFLNFLSMFLGCAVIQRVSGMVLDYVKSSGLRGGALPYEGYTYDNILTMFKFMLVLNLLSLFSAYALKDKKKDTNPK